MKLKLSNRVLDLNNAAKLKGWLNLGNLNNIKAAKWSK